MTKRKTSPRKVVKETANAYTVLFEPAAEGGYARLRVALPV